MIDRVVLDTSVLVSALLFTAGRLEWLRHAWQHRLITPVLCAPTAAELVRVLGYPKFKLSGAERDDLLADVLPYADVVRLPKRLPRLPGCRDGDDQVFLALAVVAAVDALVTGDSDLLAVRERVSVTIMTLEELPMSLGRSWPRPDR